MLERAPKGEAFFGHFGRILCSEGFRRGFLAAKPKNTKFHGYLVARAQKHLFGIGASGFQKQLGSKTTTGSLCVIARPELSGCRSRAERLVRGTKNVQSISACSQGRFRSLGLSSSAVTCSSPRASHMTAGVVENLRFWSSHLDAGCPK